MPVCYIDCNRTEMPDITSTNIRVGPGFYSAIKQLSDRSGLSMGTIANMLFMVALGRGESLKSFPAEIQQIVVADILTTISELFKVMGFAVIQDPNLQALYRRLLEPDEKKA